MTPDDTRKRKPLHNTISTQRSLKKRKFHHRTKDEGASQLLWDGLPLESPTRKRNFSPGSPDSLQALSRPKRPRVSTFDDLARAVEDFTLFDKGASDPASLQDFSKTTLVPVATTAPSEESPLPNDKDHDSTTGLSEALFMQQTWQDRNRMKSSSNSLHGSQEMQKEHATRTSRLNRLMLPNFSLARQHLKGPQNKLRKATGVRIAQVVDELSFIPTKQSKRLSRETILLLQTAKLHFSECLRPKIMLEDSLFRDICAHGVFVEPRCRYCIDASAPCLVSSESLIGNQASREIICARNLLLHAAGPCSRGQSDRRFFSAPNEPSFS